MSRRKVVTVTLFDDDVEPLIEMLTREADEDSPDQADREQRVPAGG